MVKHKSAYGCGSAIFYDMGPKRVTQSCPFTYMYDAEVATTILDGGNELLLTNFMNPDHLSVIQKMVGWLSPHQSTHMQYYPGIFFVIVS